MFNLLFWFFYGGLKYDENASIYIVMVAWCCYFLSSTVCLMHKNVFEACAFGSDPQGTVQL